MFEKICIILLVNLLFYARTIYYKYVSDDLDYYKHPPKFKTKWHTLFERLLFGKKVPSIDHALNILYHALVCVFIYLAFGASNISFLAAILFSLNPANNQASIWLSGRGYLMPTLCLLIAMALPILSPLFLFACTWFTIGYLAPLALIGSSKAYILALLPICWYLHRKKFSNTVVSKIKAEGFDEDKKFNLKKLILATKTFGFYLALCIVPFKIAFYHNFLQSCAGNKLMRQRAYTMKDKFFWIGLISLIAWVVYSILHWDMVSWGFLWFCVCIAPFLNLRRMNQEIAERYLYMPNCGLMLVLASLIINYPILITVFITMYAVRMWTIMPMYKDDYWLVEFSVMEDPNAWYGWHIRGMKRWDNASFKEALIMWVMAKMISPLEFKVLVNISTVLKMLNKHKEAEDFLKVAEQNIVAGQEEEAKKLIAESRAGKSPILI